MEPNTWRELLMRAGLWLVVNAAILAVLVWVITLISGRTFLDQVWMFAPFIVVSFIITGAAAVREQRAAEKKRAADDRAAQEIVDRNERERAAQHLGDA